MKVDGKVVIVTGAARGIGRSEAIAYARAGAHVVINDYGGDVHGAGHSLGPAQAVVAEIEDLGGSAVANAEDVSDWDGARRLVDAALDRFGRLDVLVNNAGILRDRTITNMTADEWDDVIRIHLRGTFATLRHAASHWKDLARTGSRPNASVINTSSASGLFGKQGQANYGAAKAGIAALTMIAAQELARYDVRVNAIAPAALTRMTHNIEYIRSQTIAGGAEGQPFVAVDADNVAPIVVWLGSDAAQGVSGRVFEVLGGSISIAEPWHRGPSEDKKARWQLDELDEVVPRLLAQARSPELLSPVMSADEYFQTRSRT